MDWNRPSTSLRIFLLCRTLYRYVDWNASLSRVWWIRLVVPYIGTWIETSSQKTEIEPSLCRTLYRYVDWNILVWIGNIIGISRTLYRYVDWNCLHDRTDGKSIGRTLYRYVDWNPTVISSLAYGSVVPYIGTWIETSFNSYICISSNVVPYIGTWIETQSRTVFENPCWVVPYIGTWIETRVCAKEPYKKTSYLI